MLNHNPFSIVFSLPFLLPLSPRSLPNQKKTTMAALAHSRAASRCSSAMAAPCSSARSASVAAVASASSSSPRASIALRASRALPALSTRRVTTPARASRLACAAAKGYKVALLGAAGGIGQPLALLLKMQPYISQLALYDIANVKGVAADLSHCNTAVQVRESGLVMHRESVRHKKGEREVESRARREEERRRERGRKSDGQLRWKGRATIGSDRSERTCLPIYIFPLFSLALRACFRCPLSTSACRLICLTSLRKLRDNCNYIA